MQSRVLIAEDETTMRDLLVRVTRRFFPHVAVVSVPDGITALHELRRGRFDVLITDEHMPGLTGIELIRMLRRDSQQLPIIMITAHPVASQAIEAGASACVNKPFDLFKLQRILKEHLPS